MAGRTFVVGDIHGCRIALNALCENLSLTADDTFISLGDVVDRGEDTRGALDILLEVQKSCQLIYIMGNHEEAMLDAFRSKEDFHRWLSIGGREAMDSYGRKMNNIPDTHRELLGNCVDYHETDTEIFIHANLEPGVVLSEQTASWLRWEHLTGMEYPHESGRRILCGHTQQKSGMPLIWDGWVCLDTGTYRGHPLTCLEVETNLVYRSNESGKVFEPIPLNKIANTRGR